MNWQPIETAPKDGTWILLAGGVTEDEDDSGCHRIVSAQWTNWLNGRDVDRGRWQFAWYDGGYYGRYQNPTHWAEMPEPPK